MDNADFSDAEVTITEDGNAVPVSFSEREATGLGLNSIVFVPFNLFAFGDRPDLNDAWERPQQDRTFRVTISNIKRAPERSYTYEVTVFNPMQSAEALAEGRASVVLTDEGEFFAVSASDVPHASRYEFKAGKSLPFDTHWGAEADVDWIEIDSAGSYEVVSSLRASEGERAFHLAHTTTHDETITFNQWVVPSESSLLHFDEFIGPRSTDQVRLIQVSTDRGRAWQTVFRDASSYSLLFGRPDDCASDFLKPISRPAP